MMVDDEPTGNPGETPPPTPEHMTQVADEAAETAKGGVDALAETAAEASGAASDIAQDLGERTAETYAAASRDTAKAFEEARDRLQRAGVAGLEGSQGVLDRFKAGTEQLGTRFGSQYGHASQTMAEFNAKAIEAWRTNAEATIAHWQRLAGITSWSEMIALNSVHARQQIETMTAQTRELAELAGRIGRESSEAATGSKPGDSA